MADYTIKAKAVPSYGSQLDRFARSIMPMQAAVLADQLDALDVPGGHRVTGAPQKMADRPMTSDTSGVPSGRPGASVGFDSPIRTAALAGPLARQAAAIAEQAPKPVQVNAAGAAAAGAKASADAAERPVGNAPGDMFEKKAPWIMSNLRRDFGVTREQAAGVVANLAHESGGFRHFQEIGSGPNSGGRGWAQWTGPRRVAFLRWARERGLDPRSDEANYGFLRHELQTSEARSLDILRRTRSAQQATIAFEQSFERAGVKAYASRLSYAKRAMALPEPQDAVTGDKTIAPVYPEEQQ